MRSSRHPPRRRVGGARDPRVLGGAVVAALATRCRWRRAPTGVTPTSATPGSGRRRGGQPTAAYLVIQRRRQADALSALRARRGIGDAPRDDDRRSGMTRHAAVDAPRGPGRRHRRRSQPGGYHLMIDGVTARSPSADRRDRPPVRAGRQDHGQAEVRAGLRCAPRSRVPGPSAEQAPSLDGGVLAGPRHVARRSSPSSG